MKKPIVEDIIYLRQPCSYVESLVEARTILQDLEDSLDVKRGCGLSANQIGIQRQVALIKVGEQKIVLVNPEIVEKGNPTRINGEGCLSLPGIKLVTRRYGYIKLENYDIETGEMKTSLYMGLVAIAIQHEIDHLHGMLILERKWKSR